MSPDIDPSERERALRDADAELERLRGARPKRRDVDDESWTEIILWGIVSQFDNGAITKALFLFFVAAVVLTMVFA